MLTSPRKRARPSNSVVRDLKGAIADHEDWYRSSGRAGEKRRTLARLRLRTLLRERLLSASRDRGFDENREAELVEAIAAGNLDPHSAAQRVVREVLGE